MNSALFLAYSALGLMAVIPIYWGSYSTLKNEAQDEKDSTSPKEKEKARERETETISADDAKMFPVYGSGVLFGLYLLFRYLPKEYINLILSLYFSVLGVAALANLFHPIFSPLLFLIHPKGDDFHLTFTRGLKSYYDNKFDWGHIFLGIISSALSGYYWFTKNWIISNLFGEAFALGAIQLLHLDSFKTGIILLSGLFFYDIFWVFGTEVMVSVAKSFDAPIKLVFPKDLFTEEAFQFTMLGLGDIVIPGIFVALALRFDQSLNKDKGNKNFPKPYFTACFTAYVLGLVTTVVVMQTFQAAQPALLYLSPACILSVLITAWFRGEMNELLSYAPNAKKEKEEKEKEEKEKIEEKKE